MNRRHSSTSSLQRLIDLDSGRDDLGYLQSSDTDKDYLDGSKSAGDCLDSSRDGDLDSCFSDSDVFDPPAPWRPGRFLQFADIDLTAEDEPSVRPVSLPTERLGPAGRRTSDVAGSRFESLSLEESTSRSGSFLVQMDSDRMFCSRHWKPAMSRRTLVLMASCMTVALTAMTLLSFVLY